MSQESGQTALFSRLRRDDNAFWSIITELAGTQEPERRRLLRPHFEAGFGAEDAVSIEQRSRLDATLGALTALEIAYQIGIVDAHEVLPPNLENLKILFGSQAFLRYTNAYLYFGVRFLACRVAPPKWTSESWTRKQLARDSNNRPFALVTPPSLEGSESNETNFRSFIAGVGQDTASTDSQESGRLQAQEVALRFLDGFPRKFNEPEYSEKGAKEAEHFELWLRGLRPETDATDEAYFSQLSIGLRHWALTRSDLYWSLRSPQATRPIGGWVVTKAIVARLGLADIYWIANLLRADVSANASVTYSRANWLHLLRFQAGLQGDTVLENALWKAEEILRSVFDFVCDLVQNAVEITSDRERRAYEPELITTPPAETAKWRRVFDEELEEIERQRKRRQFKDSTPLGEDKNLSSNQENDGWRERIRTGKEPRNLIGLAFSGGGIRSATFNLGVLQALQEFDLLRRVDYLSTVSGGGFIGSWLVGNVCRTAHWLGRLTNWEESIAHLRRYSKYLAPRAGLLSADTWTMWGSWARNAFLIQLTGLAWLTAVLLLALLGQSGFQRIGELPNIFHETVLESGLIVACLMAFVFLTLLYNLRGNRAATGNAGVVQVKWIRQFAAWLLWKAKTRKAMRRFAAWIRSGGKAFPADLVWAMGNAPLCVVSFLFASILWADATGRSPLAARFQGVKTYSAVLSKASSVLPDWLGVLWMLALAVIGFFTVSHLQKRASQCEGWQRKRIVGRRIWHAAWISLVCTLVLYLELCGVMCLFLRWSVSPDRFNWYAYVFGPPLVMAANIISVVLFVGFCGRNSNESIREWWTRFGAWVAIVGLAYLALTMFAVFAPKWTLYFLQNYEKLKWGAIASWIGTIVGGLLAGNSSRTSGNSSSLKAPVLEFVAKLGGLLFIIGAIIGVSTTLFLLLINIGNIGFGRGFNYLSHYWDILNGLPELPTTSAALIAAIASGLLFSTFFEINIFGLNQFYRSRLVRCYLGATRWAPGVRKPQPFTEFDGNDDIRLSHFSKEFRGPFPILNCALNLSGSSDLTVHTRHSASFSLTPLRCGADRERVGYAPTKCFSGQFADGVMLGQAVAISGAAASPNMGYNTSPLAAFLLTMFNVRLGWWFPNPGQNKWKSPGLSFSLYYLIKELFGNADETNRFVNVSDGGHFENLGIYELVRRRCKVIIASDAECDELLQFGSLGRLVRLCETDFGAKIDINVSSIRQQKNGYSLGHCSVGRITYSNGSIGYLIYLKASISGDEDVGVAQYHSIHPSFPHETTADQFFTEDQFESYRQLGQHIVRHSLRGAQPGDHPVDVAERLADVLAPAGCTSETFLTHTKTLDQLWERLRQSSKLHPFMTELMRDRIPPSPAPAPTNPGVPMPADADQQNQEKLIGLELIQLMEDVFLDLRLDDFWDHPDNRGWALLFMRWARSPRFRAIWGETRRTFGIRFEYFCEARLGLSRDKPIVRV